SSLALAGFNLNVRALSRHESQKDGERVAVVVSERHELLSIPAVSARGSSIRLRSLVRNDGSSRFVERRPAASCELTGSRKILNGDGPAIGAVIVRLACAGHAADWTA